MADCVFGVAAPGARAPVPKPPKLPNVLLPEEVSSGEVEEKAERARFTAAERTFGGKDVCVGEATSCSSSSATGRMLPGGVETASAVEPDAVGASVLLKGLLPGKVLSARPGWLECRCERTNSWR